MENNYISVAAKGFAHGTIDGLIREHGTVAVLAFIKKGMESETKPEEIKKQEMCPVFTGIINPIHYGGTNEYQKREFDRHVLPKTEKILEYASKMHDLDLSSYGESGDMKIRHIRFAEWIIQKSGEEMFRDILEILSDCPDWIKGRGISRFKMELLFHVLILHKDQREQVKMELKKFLRNYDQESLKVTANQDDEFRNTLSYESKMIAFTEKKICEKLNLERQFIAA